MTTVFKHKNDIILIHMKTTETTERCFLATYVFNSLDKQWLGKHNTICESFKIRSDSNLMKQKRGAGGGTKVLKTSFQWHLSSLLILIFTITDT